MNALKHQVVTKPCAPAKPSDELIAEFLTSSRTAIGRPKPTAPLNQLLPLDVFKGRVLHYGKGRAGKDTEALMTTADHVTEYDYVFAPYPEVMGDQYDVVWAAYVVNTLKPEPRDYVWQQIASVCEVAYIAARSNTDRGIKGTPFEDGVITSIGTFQKGYHKGELAAEAGRFFAHVREIPTKGTFRIVECRHNAGGV